MSETVIIGMSGGVDSSVSALLLKQQGYRVIALFMKNWEEKEGTSLERCTAAQDFEDVARVCDLLDIPYYGVNFSQEYWDQVFIECLEEFKKGHTPNPDILCNREIKFKTLFDKAKELGGKYLATGHYCRTRFYEGEYQLLKGYDAGKDQSYFLYTLKSDLLSQILFPIGGMVKNEVRALARKHRLPVSEKKDSTGICFIGKRNFKEFLSQYICFQPGNFENMKGEVVGQHDGVAFYTIGQRKGLRIGGAGEAWYVVGKDPLRNVVIIDQGANHSALFSDYLTAVEVSWVSLQGAPSFPFSCLSKIRYRQQDQLCVLEGMKDGRLQVRFPQPQRAVTSRQSIVFYNDEGVCLGGGIID